MNKRTPAPLNHMDMYTRNKRRYNTLLGMGLWISAICKDNDGDKIDSIQVSAGGPELGVAPYIRVPAEGPEVSEDVGATTNTRDNVIGGAPGTRGGPCAPPPGVRRPAIHRAC